MRPDTPAVRDRILAVLRDARLPMSTDAVADAAGGYLVVVPCSARSNHRIVRDRVVVCDQHADVVRSSLMMGQRAYRELRALERQGLVVSARPTALRAVYWQTAILPDPADQERLAELEEIWQRSPSA